MASSGARRIAVHAEDEARLEERKALAKDSAHTHPDWRDEETALRATKRLVRLASEAGRRVHVLHVTTAQEMAFLADHKDVASVEVTPQHLTLAAPDCYDALGTRAQMNPPIRDATHRDALWRAVSAGVVDVIGSDHAPHTLEDKARPYPLSPAGMPGVQTIVPIMLDHVWRPDSKLPCLEHSLVHLVEHLGISQCSPRRASAKGFTRILLPARDHVRHLVVAAALEDSLLVHRQEHTL